MKQMGDAIACVIDSGLYFGLAERLARDFKKVFYHTHWATWAPFARDVMPGRGYEDKGVFRADYPLHLIDTEEEPDLWVFPHLAETDLQYLLRSLGKKVWGSGDGHAIENDRWMLKELLEARGLNVTPSVEVVGTDALREQLETVSDKWIKVSMFRGDMPTWQHTDWANSQIWWSELCEKLGAARNEVRFIVEDPIPDAIETGTDNLFAHGVPLFPMTIGYEVKDAAYFAKVIHLSDGLPMVLSDPLSHLADYLEQNKYSNFFSTEMRITKKGECFVTDVTARMPSPAGELQLELWKNFSEVLYRNVDGGAVVSPKPVAQYAVQLTLKSDFANKHWIQVEYPKAIYDRVKLFLPTRIEGHVFAIPDREVPTEDVGTVVGLGNSLVAAKDDAKRIADQIKGSGLHYDESVFDKADEQIEQGRAVGIDF